MACVDPAQRPPAALSWLALAFLMLLGACSSDSSSPEQQLRHLVGAMEQALEQGAVSDAARFISPVYRDKFHPDKRSAVRSLFGYMQRHRNVHLFVRIQELALAEDQRKAQMALQVAMTADPVETTERLVDMKADLYRFEIHLAWSDREETWQITSAQWKRADISSLLQ